MPRHNPWILPAWLSLGAILYITLLPFRFEDLAFAEAWEAYRSMCFGELRASARQQWIANAFMFLPLGFFWMAWLSRGVRTVAGRMAIGVFVALLCLTVTATVEFIQAWIPRRVPSLIDLSGNFTGGVAGVLLWTAVGGRLQLWRQWSGQYRLKQALTTYVVIYVFAALVPFDFLLSWSEWQGKLASGHWGWWSAASGCDGGLRCGALRGLEVAMTAPVGVWLALRYRLFADRPLLASALGGLGLGLALEIGQLMTVSGIAEGMSVLARGIGVAVGVAAFHYREQLLQPEWLARHGRVLVAGFVGPYLLLLVALILGFPGWHLDMDRMPSGLAGINWLPFFNHYLMVEATAIASVILYLAIFAPVGIGVWLWSLPPHARRRPWHWLAAGWGASLALVIETGKFFVDGKSADVTSLLVAAVAASSAFSLLSWSWRQWLGLDKDLYPGRNGTAPAQVPAPPPSTRGSGPPATRTPVAMRATAMILGLVTLVACVTWPVASIWLLAGLALYVAVLWRWPAAWLLVIPAMVPVLNLSLYSGRFFFDELDLLILTTLAVAAWRWRPGRGIPHIPRPAVWALAAFIVSVLLSLSIALFPWQTIDINAWSHYASQYNALRIAKGFLWALLLIVLLGQSDRPTEDLLRHWFVPGMAAGLLLGVMVILRERLTYSGLFNFDSPYRISGLFTDMHAGGPSVETWLVMATPFVLLWAWQQRSWFWLAPALAVFAAAVYAVAVTYSRGGYLGLLVALVVIMIGSLIASRSRGGFRGQAGWLRFAALASLPLVAAGFVVVQVAGGFADQRMSRIAADFEQRVDLWSQARWISSSTNGVNLWGNGVGAYPRLYHAGNPEGRIPGNYRIIETADGRHLRIGRGDSLYMNQRVRLPRVEGYRLEVRYRLLGAPRLSVHVCEKYVRHSFSCRVGRFEAAEADGEWAMEVWEFGIERFADPPFLWRRGITVALSHGGRDGLVDIDSISLVGPDGREYLRNGGFSRGLDHWYPTTDHLASWRVENQWLEIWFDQGWFGLLAFTALTLIAALVMTRRLLQGSLVHAFLLAALTGALAVGLFSTIFWSPRLMLLFFLILLLGLVFKDYSRAISAGMEPGSAPRR